MSDAIADGNHIFRRIASTAVFQNQNCTPLFVPNALSLSHLFFNVVQQANFTPGEVSVVEAHGTETPAGDWCYLPDRDHRYDARQLLPPQANFTVMVHHITRTPIDMSTRSH